ncbi:sorting nexin-31 isoform X3 [Neophocaena asiaeorientalis asiaeorientalis]|uniref:Sorting nexin-31 isoform X3 n=1 Tax=Neophocaena asiaeorientalis asiaeorientalis TaxID=1706337 RepID=A0A341CC01_NEOAA|nr:sorting nexin-31 isoform X3 [Neophocaena asiaeorientalis asiaeorientalis]
MKMHFCIPVSQQRPDALGGRYVLYSVYLDGFLFCKVRYSQLHRWNEQLRRVFGNCLPPFPPKYYLAMTASMADERRDQLEQYLQNVTMDPNMLRSDVFVDFLKLVQLDTFSITTEKASLDIFLPDGRSIKVEILTSDTAERVLETVSQGNLQTSDKKVPLSASYNCHLENLEPWSKGQLTHRAIYRWTPAQRVAEVVSHKIGLCQELLGYFGLFLIRSYKEGKLSVIKKLVDFELPYVSLRSSEVENFKVGLRKWYLDPSLDSRLMDCRAAVDLIYVQAIQDIEKEWAKPTEVQRQKLEALQKEGNQTKFLELSQEVWHYGYVQLDPCTCDYPEPGCGTVLSVGNDEISCCITLPDNRTRDVIFQMNRVKCWQVTFLGTLLDTDGPQQTLNQNLELRFQYSEESHWQWFVIYTKQAFLLSSCLKKMISEKMVKLAAENPEMQIEVPEQGKSKKHHSQQSQKDYSSFLPRKSKIKTAEVDCGLGTIKEEGL